VSYARPSGEDIKETNLYVTNLPRAVNEELLEVIFGKYGRIGTSLGTMEPAGIPGNNFHPRRPFPPAMRPPHGMGAGHPALDYPTLTSYRKIYKQRNVDSLML
ncbi:Sex-lethal, partial [Operophtera brumata]